MFATENAVETDPVRTTPTPLKTTANFAHDSFVPRHVGPSPVEVAAMLETCGFATLDALIDKAVPAGIRLGRELDLPPALSEHEALARLRAMAAKNRVCRSFLGMGYHDCITPPVIQRNVLENPGWYTQYTPYQAEISQGRLEALLLFQTMVCDLTAMDIANASLLDEATGAAEAMGLAFSARGGETKSTFFVSEACHSQTIEVVRTRAWPLGVKVVVGDHRTFAFDDTVFGALVQYPATDGVICDYREFIGRAHAANALVTVATDLLALCLIEPPGEFGADIAVGSAQRFGVPLGYGGPHAAFFATRDEFKRSMPGRIVGVSKDTRGRPAFRLSLQTREQHIRREKATSNICTAQALLANMAAFYAVYHGPEGLKAIADRVHSWTVVLAKALRDLGHSVGHDGYFDTLRVKLGSGSAEEVHDRAWERQLNFRSFDDGTVGVSLDETTDGTDILKILQCFGFGRPFALTTVEDVISRHWLVGDMVNEHRTTEFYRFARKSAFLTEPVFNRHHSETEMLRFLRRLESRDLSLCHSMIPLGSCTMKLNASAEMFPVSWPEFGAIHPFAPLRQTEGYLELFRDLEGWLAEITGFAAISLQPNAGSQGEYAGLLVIHKYHESRGEGHRDVCLIPTSAHGTNPASAVMAGMKVVPVACDKQGNIDVTDLRAKATEHGANLAALMVTYPSTHGVFEETIREVCQIVHEHGGQVYLDGANLNAQVGLCRPGDMGADVCHLNLHKTFCIPHGGGGPGMGPIGVAEHLVDFLPDHPVVNLGGEDPIGPVSAAPWGSASILPISWMYIAMMGARGLTEATKVAILNANYIARRLEPHFPVLYKGHGGLVAHECIVDLRPFKSVTAEDVAKRLIDYGFHAPTLSWPVAGTLMIEPTESESKEELDRFCDAMIAIHGEIKAIENGESDKANNPLKNAPHTADQVCADEWIRPYSREQAAFPAAWLREFKFWPHVSRIDNVYGDRNLVCSCAGMEAYQG
jgi:glycine dehydrogenase